MLLLLSIILGIVISLVIAMLVFPPYLSGFVAFGILLGIMFRGIYLLNEINNNLKLIKDKKETVKKYHIKIHKAK